MRGQTRQIKGNTTISLVWLTSFKCCISACVESLSIELVSKKFKKTFCQQSHHQMGVLKLWNFLKHTYSISLKFNNLFYASKDFNNLDYRKNEKVAEFLNLTFEYGFVPVINKPTWVAKNTATAIDHIITNSLLHRALNTGIIKLDISDYFPIYLIAETKKRMTPEEKVQITKRLINNKTK